MPNNRNRNRNRNRNKRNRNQNQQQTKQEPQQEQDQEQEQEQPEQPKEERDQQEETTPALLPTLDENENSGSNSNGSSSSSNTSNAQQALTKKTPSHEEATRVTVEADVVSAQQQQQQVINNNSSDDDDNNNNKMGAKNSKHQKEKREKSQEKLEEKHVEQSSATTTIVNDKPPGSPRQVRVIVHRIVREDETDFARNDTQQQQVEEDDETRKVAAQEEQLKVEQQQQQYNREQEEVDLLIKTLQQPEIKQQLVKEQQSFPQTISPEKVQKTEIVKETQHVQQKQQHKIVLHKIQLEQEEPQQSPQSCELYSKETKKVEKLQQTESVEESKQQKHIPLQQTEEQHKIVLHTIQLEQKEPQQSPPNSVQPQSESYAKEETTQETKLQQAESIDEIRKQCEQQQHVARQQEQKTEEQNNIVLHAIHLEQQEKQQSPHSSDPKAKEAEEQLQQTENLEESQKKRVQQQYEQQQHVPQQQQEKVVHHKIHQEQSQESPPLQRSHKVIIHKIHIETDAEERERRGKPTIEEISSNTIGTAQATAPINNMGGTLSPPPRYLVESPSPKTTKDLIPAQFLKSSSSGIQIQELEFNSDASSGEFNYPPLQSPLVSEVESETEATTPTQLPKTTSSPDMSSISRAEQQEQLRQKRAQKRNALETHFLPQLLSPRYLDSILEENGDGSTAAAAAATAEQLHAKSNQNSSSSAQRIAKANEMFPKSQLDFSRRHKRREEPVALMLETRLLEQCTDDLESCTRLESTLSPQSEDAELVYLSSSASSSMSDLELELELEQAAALAERTLVDLDTDATKLMEGSQNRAASNDAADADEMSSTTTTEPATETETETEVETEDGGGEANESRESTPVNQQQQQPTESQSQADGSLLRTTPTPTTTTTTTNNNEEETVANVAKENSVSLQAASSLAATREHFLRNMDKVRELIEMTRREEEIIDNEKSVADNGPESDSIKKLRLLCTETLASMPYGEQVLEELANVAQNIAKDQIANKMPYPMPDLPHIRELQLSTKENEKYTTSTTSSAWLGLPTEADPKLLVCLSPTQRELVEQQQQPKADQLLDDHQKFMERRGYNELSKEQVRVIDNEKQMEQQQQMLNMAAKMRELRKSLTPTPPPVPKKSAETAAKATATAATAAAATSSIENKPKKQTVEQQQSSHSTTSQMSSTTTSSTTATTNNGHNGISSKFPSSMESELARMFPSLQQQGDIFAEQRKRFSNIESESKNFPELKLNQNQSKRYSNIETKSYESKKRTENGQVIYDITNSSHEKQVEGDKDLSKVDDEVKPPPIPPPPMMSETKLNGNTQANTFIKDDVFIKNSQTKDESKNAASTYEEFRQRAKAAVDAIGQGQSGPGLDTDNVFKDFDRLSQQLNKELQSTREHRQKSASLYDLSGLTRQTSCQSQQQLNQLKQQRHAHMQELEKEIERSARSRMERMSSVEPKTYQIPIEMEANNRSRRSESLCNLNEVPRRPHTSAGVYKEEDDWSRYASDLGYSENIARPFAREVEICYQRQRPNHGGIRAPRLLSASSNDLSSFTSYDSFNAYGGRRTHAPMLSEAPQQQQQRPQYASCYSLIERNPNPTYISTTSRRGTSPAPPQVAPPPPPPAYDRQQRRSSLPRELHEQQLKYILSKEEELKLEVERLQHERRRLMEEMQRAPVINPSQRRESYRPAPKLPTLSEDEVFRQQMAEEWMNKVAERDERRHQKIIKISKIEDEPEHLTTEQANISDEFLNRVKERRHKLSMPADSDWESGAESQPQGKAAQSGPESEPETSVHILEGQTEANLRQLPRHLREFAKFSTQEQLPDGGQMEHHEQQEKREDFTDNSHSSATKKSSIIKTYKVSRLPPSVQARPSYKSNGYVSEPEPNYDSDYSTVRYRTQNPHRVQSVSSAVNVRNLNQDEKLYGTMPNPIKSAQNSYKNQPGRIENYTTGHSSVSEKEKKEWWDEVMDIFNGNLEQSKLSPLYTEGNLSRALAKESGYTSDSNLVFRKKELSFGSPLSPVEQKQAYKSLQAGGEPPLLGFRKPAPEKPKDYDSSAPPIPPQPPIKGLVSPLYDEPDVNIHFKTPVRHEYKQNISEEELAIRQAEHMQKLYQEERRRKYLQELQDMNSRRHTDNFTPSQKSPIALNRYDDFPTDVTLKSLVGPKTVAKALYNFQGQTSKELSFRKGDTIYIRRQIDANWFEGEHNAMIGLLPASYVEIVSRDGARTPAKRPSEGQARAKYNFQAQSGIELSLNKGELVTLTRRVDGNWFEGKIANRKGIFPVSYVEILTDIGAEDIAARTTTTVINSQSTTNLRPNLDVLRTNINNEFNTLTQNGAQPPNGILKDTRGLHKTDALHVDTTSEPVAYRALYKYRPQNSDELELLEGDLVHVLEKCDDGWFVGTSQRTGCFGTFPGNYVERA
ncbi:uncharacterized protein CAP isoform X5 [Drosophila tropicalis]|uniref:uncharacterized protein CAP isoform X5 n=1 Tax=Drosophila tropicalis TaxID=46794 RepID=UPI0035ABFE1E